MARATPARVVDLFGHAGCYRAPGWPVAGRVVEPWRSRSGMFEWPHGNLFEALPSPGEPALGRQIQTLPGVTGLVHEVSGDEAQITLRDPRGAIRYWNGVRS